MKAQELHLWLDFTELSKENYNISITTIDTLRHFKDGDRIIHTVIPHFLQWIYGEKLFVHCNGECHEITLGKCEGTEKEIREVHNLERILFAGGFDWWQK